MWTFRIRFSVEGVCINASGAVMKNFTQILHKIEVLYGLNLCLFGSLEVSSAGDGFHSSCSFRLSSEKSFHRLSLLRLPRLPPPHTLTTCRLGNTACAWTSHTSWWGDITRPGGDQIHTQTVTARQVIFRQFACVLFTHLCCSASDNWSSTDTLLVYVV